MGADEDKKGVFGGMRLLEWTNKVVPQSLLVKSARTSWNLLWKAMMSELAPQSTDGTYVRPSYTFRGMVSPTGRDFPVEMGRYHIYVGNACPWCHRVLLTLALRGLKPQHVSVSFVEDDPERASRGGWAFSPSNPDPVFGCSDLRAVYEECSPGYRGRCTAPVMVDKKRRCLVNNESSDIIRMLNEIDPTEAPGPKVDLYPQALRGEIDEVNDRVYHKVNNGVYKAGFATSQPAYNQAVEELTATLDWLDNRLASHRFLVGDRVTEADVRLFPTAIRYDAIYTNLFKCSTRRISSDLPHVHRWLRTMYHLPGVKATFDLDAAMKSYYKQLFPLNPGGIVPATPDLTRLVGRLDDPPLVVPQGEEIHGMFHYK